MCECICLSPPVQLFMAIIWAVIEVMYLFLFTHLPTVKEEEEETAQSSPNTIVNGDSIEPDEKKCSLNGEPPSGLQDSDYSTARHSSIADEKSPLLPDPSHQMQYKIQTNELELQKTERNLCDRLSREVNNLLWLVKELMREEIVLLLALLFFTFFNQMTMEVRRSVVTISCYNIYFINKLFLDWFGSLGRRSVRLDRV